MTLLLAGIALLLLFLVIARRPLAQAIGDIRPQPLNSMWQRTKMLATRRPDSLEPTNAHSFRSFHGFDLLNAAELPYPNLTARGRAPDSGDEYIRLRNAFQAVTDCRPKASRQYPLATLLTIATAASLEGSAKLTEIVEWAQNLPPEKRAQLGLGNRPAPSFVYFYLALRDVCQDEVDAALATWMNVPSNGSLIALRQTSKASAIALPGNAIEPNAVLRGVVSTATSYSSGTTAELAALNSGQERQQFGSSVRATNRLRLRPIVYNPALAMPDNAKQSFTFRWVRAVEDHVAEAGSWLRFGSRQRVRG